MKKFSKESFIRYTYLSIVFIYLCFYVYMVIQGYVGEFRLLSMLGGLFIISAGLLYLAKHQKNHLLMVASSMLLVITILDTFINYLDIIDSTFESNVYLNIVFQSLGSFAILLILYALFDEVKFVRKLMQIKEAAYDKNEVIYFVFDRNTRLFHLECSEQFAQTYNLFETHYVFDLEGMSHIVTFNNKVNLADLNHKNIKSLEKTLITIRLPEMAHAVQMTINGIYFHEHKIIFITIDIDLLKNSLSLVSKLNKEKAIMLESINVGIAEQELIFENGIPIDYRFLYVNQAFNTLTGIPKETAIDHLASQVLGEAMHDLLPIYTRVVYEDVREDFEYFLESNQRWYQVTTYKKQQTRFITVFTDITAIKKVAEEQAYMIYHDSLTGLLNEYGLTQAIFALEQIEHALCYFIDIRDFATIVDFYGLDVSAAIISQIAQYIKHYPHQHKLVSRYGGDLFVIIVLNPDQAEKTRLHTYMKEIIFKDYSVGDVLLQVRNQIGYACYPEDVSKLQDLVAAASMASKRSAKSERNIIVKYHEEFKSTKAKELLLAKLIKKAIDMDLMQVYFQKVIDTEHQRIYAVESLARWTDPELGYIPPDYFFRVAQDFNLIDYLEDYMIDKSIKEFSLLLKLEAFKETCLSVNISPQVFLSHEEPSYVYELCQRYNISPNRVIIEISENVFTLPMDLIKQAITDYKGLGFKIAIDDFGSEYSSLSILNQIDYDIIKIDGSFIRALDQVQNQEICKMIVKVAKTIEKRIIAESVETESDAQFLKSIHCYLHQGYFYHKPQKMN